MADMKSVYYSYFEKSILPVIKPLEQERVKTVHKVVLTSLLFFFIGIVFAGLFILNAVYSFVNPIVLPLLLFLMYSLILRDLFSLDPCLRAPFLLVKPIKIFNHS